MDGCPLPPGVLSETAAQALFEFEFCRYMHWTGNQLDAEPAWRVDLWQAMFRKRAQQMDTESGRP